MLTIFQGERRHRVIDISSVVSTYTAYNRSEETYDLHLSFISGEKIVLEFKKESDIDRARLQIINHTAKGQKGKPMLKSALNDFTEFMKDNRNVIYTVALALLIDHYVFDGAFRDRIKSVVEGLIKKAETEVSTVRTATGVVQA